MAGSSCRQQWQAAEAGKQQQRAHASSTTRKKGERIWSRCSGRCRRHARLEEAPGKQASRRVRSAWAGSSGRWQQQQAARQAGSMAGRHADREHQRSSSSSRRQLASLSALALYQRHPARVQAYLRSRRWGGGASGESLLLLLLVFLVFPYTQYKKKTHAQSNLIFCFGQFLENAAAFLYNPH